MCLGGVYVDGFNPNTRTVYQFHGCPDCFHPYSYNELTDCRFYQLYEQMVQNTNDLIVTGYNVFEMWECDFIRTKCLMRSRIKANKKFYHAIPLNPRDALFGGRTSPSCLYKECNENEKIFYVDFTLLHPFVQKYEYYPVGHPVIYVGNNCSDLVLEDVHGLVKCKVLPPIGLFFPILLCRINGKLLFSLCRKCGGLMFG